MTMYDSTRRRSRRRHWCCSFTTPPLSPDNPTPSTLRRTHSSPKKTEMHTSNSPTSHPQKLRWILSPGRVSPISDVPPEKKTIPLPMPPPKSPISEVVANGEGSCGILDVRLNVKGKNGGESLILELNSEVLAGNSSVFGDLIADHRRNSLGSCLCRIEVPDVENLGVFRETIELMFEEDDIQKKILDIGVFRSIDILEVSAGIKFGRGISACLKYLEAVPWTEEEEEKLGELFAKLNFDDAMATNILDRLSGCNSVDSHRTFTKQLIWSVATSTDTSARNEMKSLIKGLLSKSSIYKKGHPDLNKDDMYAACNSFLGLLVSLLQEASGIEKSEKLTEKGKDKPLLERISKQVDNINWLLDILLDHQMAGEFVDLWANQVELLKMYEFISPIIRYELSRVSATLFVALGTGKLHCRSETRLKLLLAWFRPMLSDFGWLQRCKKGLDVKVLEEAMGQALLTLPLKEQYTLFMDWFQCFSKKGMECPNLSKAFQVWWRRHSSGALRLLPPNLGEV